MFANEQQFREAVRQEVLAALELFNVQPKAKPAPAPPQQPMIIKEVMARYQISRTTLLLAIAAGDLKAWKASPRGKWLIWPGDAERYFKRFTPKGRK